MSFVDVAAAAGLIFVQFILGPAMLGTMLGIASRALGEKLAAGLFDADWDLRPTVQNAKTLYVCWQTSAILLAGAFVAVIFSGGEDGWLSALKARFTQDPIAAVPLALMVGFTLVVNHLDRRRRIEASRPD